jgi:hypothetical protein
MAESKKDELSGRMNAKQKALTVLDECEMRRLDKELFRKPLHHHLGGSFGGFYRFPQTVNSFKPLECNQFLLDHLKFILDEIRHGASPTGQVSKH